MALPTAEVSPFRSPSASPGLKPPTRAHGPATRPHSDRIHGGVGRARSNEHQQTARPTCRVGGRLNSLGDRSLSAAWRTDVRSGESSGMRLLDDAVLGAGRIGGVERGTKPVTFGLRESDSATEQPLRPLSLGQVLNLGVGDHQCLELIPVECDGFNLGARQLWQPGWFLRNARRGESSAEQQLDRGDPGHGRRRWGTSTRLRLPQSVHSNSTQAGFDADVAASSSVRRLSSTFRRRMSSRPDGSLRRRRLIRAPRAPFLVGIRLRSRPWGTPVL